MIFRFQLINSLRAVEKNSSFGFLGWLVCWLKPNVLFTDGINIAFLCPRSASLNCAVGVFFIGHNKPIMKLSGYSMLLKLSFCLLPIYDECKLQTSATHFLSEVIRSYFCDIPKIEDSGKLTLRMSCSESNLVLVMANGQTNLVFQSSIVISAI